jgi:hypothetical protein
VFFVLIVLPLAVAAATSVLLVRREAAASAGTATRHTPRAAGFGRGGQPLPVEPGDAGLSSLLEPDYYRPAWVRLLRIVVLAVLLAATAAAIAGGIFFLLREAGLALKSFMTGA